jgi:hypothetical protein
LTTANHSPDDPEAHTTPSAVEVKPGFIHEVPIFSSVPVALGEHLPTEVGYDAELQSGQDPGEVLVSR